MHILGLSFSHSSIVFIDTYLNYVQTCLSKRLIVFKRIHIGTNVTCVLGVNALQPMKSQIVALDLCGC